MALLRQLSCDGGSDKSGRARDKDLHRASFGQSDADPRPDISEGSPTRQNRAWSVRGPLAVCAGSSDSNILVM